MIASAVLAVVNRESTIYVCLINYYIHSVPMMEMGAYIHRVPILTGVVPIILIPQYVFHSQPHSCLHTLFTNKHVRINMPHANLLVCTVELLAHRDRVSRHTQAVVSTVTELKEDVQSLSKKQEKLVTTLLLR